MPRYKTRNIANSLDFGATTGGNDVTIENSGSEVWNGTDSLTIFLRFKPHVHPTGTSYLFSIPATANNNRRYIRQSSDGKINVAVGALTLVEAAPIVRIGQWQSITLVTDNANSLWRAYYNGVLSKDWTAFTPSTGVADITIGNNTDSSTFGSVALQSEVRMWNRVLDANEVSALEFSNTVPNGLVGEWLLNEGSGTTATDTSGNGRNGVISGATWSTDAQFKSRLASTRNNSAVYNGDFEIVPSVITAPTNTVNRYIDGTAGGSSSDLAFGWGVSVLSGSAQAGFDSTVSHSGTYSMKLSTLNASANIVVSTYRVHPSPILPMQLFRLLPNVEYRVSAWVKTTNANSNSVFISLRQFSANLTILVTDDSAKLTGTNDWTFLSFLVTNTNASTVYGTIFLRNTIVGNVSDAWFDEVSVTRTDGIGRVAASSRNLIS